MRPLLEVNDLAVSYGGIQALRGLTLSLSAGEVIALLGANGAGKTSAIEAISGLAPKSGGTVFFAGDNITHKSGSWIAQAGLAAVTQWRDLFPNFSVDETLKAALHSGKKRGRTTLDDIYELFPKLEERREQTAGTLSGGEQQMLAIGRALATEPQVLLLDEPTTGLAVGVVNDLILTIKKIRQRNIPILLVEQNLTLAASLADNCIVLATGKSVWRGPMSQAVQSEEVQHSYFGLTSR